MANDKLTLREKLQHIQLEMKSNKTLWNDFSKFNYRSAEGIIEDFKPFEASYNVTALIYDTIEEFGGRVYIKATAKLMDLESDEFIEVTAYAREPETKKGMDESQITGAASSYARKYALSGLFLLDDNKDADSNEYYQRTQPAPKAEPKPEAKPEPKKKATKKAPAGKDDPARVELREYIKANNLDAGEIMALCEIGPESTTEDYENALIFAKSLIG